MPGFGLAYLVFGQTPRCRSGSSARPPRRPLDGPLGRLVGRHRRAPPREHAALHRWLPEQLVPRAHLRLQRARPDHRRRDRLGRRRWRRRRYWGATGLGRMFNSEIGGQISWLIPSALILLAVGLFFRGRRPRTDTRRAAYVVWGALARSSRADVLADGRHLPRVLHRRPRAGHRRPRRHGRRGGLGAPATARSARSRWPRRPPRPPSGASCSSRGPSMERAGCASSSWRSASRQRSGSSSSGGSTAARVPVVIGAALFAALAGPAAYCVQTVGTGHTGSIVDAGPTVAGGTGGPGGGGGAPAVARHPAARPRARRRAARGPRAAPAPGGTDRRVGAAGRHGRPARRLDPEHRGRLGPVGQRGPVHAGSPRRSARRTPPGSSSARSCR